MNANLLLLIETDFNNTQNSPLDKLSWYAYWDCTKQKYLRAIPLENIESVIEILGENLELDPEDVKRINAIANRPSVVVELPKWKGKDDVTIETFPKFFRYTEHRKSKEDGKISTSTYEIPVEIVNELWDYLKTRPIGKCTDWSTVAENMCERLGIDRFNRVVEVDAGEYSNEGTFDKQKFFGARQKGEGYFEYYYRPLKVLEWYGVVAHSGHGKITRLKDVWDHQTKFETMKTEGIEE